MPHLTNKQASFRVSPLPRSATNPVQPNPEPVVQSLDVLRAIQDAYGLDRIPQNLSLSDVKGLLQVNGGACEPIGLSAGGAAAAGENPFTITWQIDHNPTTSGVDQGTINAAMDATLNRNYWWRIDHIHLYLSTFNAGTAINLSCSLQPVGLGWGIWRTNNGAAYVRNDYSGPLWVPPGQTFQLNVPSWNKALAGSWSLDVVGIQSPVADPMSAAGAFDIRQNPI